MARASRRLPENASGEFYVDSSCIDCETCMIVAPEVFAESAREQAFVHHQPAGPAERRRAFQALVSCPTASIGTTGEKRRSGAEAAAAAGSFPLEIEPGIDYCGFAAESSFGASSYLVRRAAGNVLVDSPRASEPLLERIEERGGVALLFLTHKDDVADHARFHARFGCARILHRRDLGPGLEAVELPLEGEDPVPLAPDLLAIPVPGHTAGSAALLHRDVLFSGDHLWGEPDGRLGAGPGVCWYSWSEQRRSLERLLEHPWRQVLPGHGRPWRAASVPEAHAELRALLARLPRG